MNEWLTLNEAAAYLKIQPRTLALWARQKKVPAHRAVRHPALHLAILAA